MEGAGLYTAARHKGEVMVQRKLGLFVSGRDPQSQRAMNNLHEMCDAGIAAREDVEVIDVNEEPERASREDVFVTPMLLCRIPKPVRRVIGDLSDRSRVLAGLNIRPLSGVVGR